MSLTQNVGGHSGLSKPEFSRYSSKIAFLWNAKSSNTWELSLEGEDDSILLRIRQHWTPTRWSLRRVPWTALSDIRKSPSSPVPRFPPQGHTHPFHPREHLDRDDLGPSVQSSQNADMCRNVPERLRSARMTLVRNPCMSKWILPFFTLSVMMDFTDPRASMHASWIFHLPKGYHSLVKQTTVTKKVHFWGKSIPPQSNLKDPFIYPCNPNYQDENNKI